MRKHFKQMTKPERQLLCGKVQEMLQNKLGVTTHAYERLKEKGITQEHINLIYSGYTLIEYHAMQNVPTVVIRSKKGLSGEQVCIAVMLKNGVLKSAWLNNIEDQHTTLNNTLYNAKLKVVV